MQQAFIQKLAAMILPTSSQKGLVCSPLYSGCSLAIKPCQLRYTPANAALTLQSDTRRAVSAGTQHASGNKCTSSMLKCSHSLSPSSYRTKCAPPREGPRPDHVGENFASHPGLAAGKVHFKCAANGTDAFW